jgi:hypothetical protein
VHKTGKTLLNNQALGTGASTTVRVSMDHKRLMMSADGCDRHPKGMGVSIREALALGVVS